MRDIFGDIKGVDLSETTCHTGGAKGADSIFELYSLTYGAKVKAYSYQTPYHKSKNKVELTENEYLEGVTQIHRANKLLNRWNVEKYMNLLARNWFQIKNASQVFIVGTIIEAGAKNKDGYYNKSGQQVVDGGSGYAFALSILENKPTFVFDQSKGTWYEWSYPLNKFKDINDEDVYITSNNFAGVGTRKLNFDGENAILNLFKNTLDK